MYRRCLVLLLAGLLLAILAFTACGGGETTPAKSDEEVVFPDRYLERAIRNAINKPDGPLYPADLAQLTSFDYSGLETDITGLEYCTNLETLDLGSNGISDIAPPVANSGLAGVDVKNLEYNPLSRASLEVYIPQLQARVVSIKW